MGERRPNVTVALAVIALLTAAGLAAAAIERNWAGVDRPVLCLVLGVLTALALLGLWLWIWLGNFTAPNWLNLPVWIVPIAATAVALKPSSSPETLSVLAYSFLVPYLLGCAVFSIAGRVMARKHPREEGRRRAGRALRWMDR
jgi:hypothetical protein